jgi:KaiC/GvpD/RAD55 family RecA-like ATPase
MSIDADELRSRLDAHDYRRILRACGFDLNGHGGNELSGVLGPKELGEGSAGNFSVNLEKGLVKDFGSSGYEGDVIDVVQDVYGLDFPEALERIVDEVNLNASTLERDGANGSSSGATPESNPPESGSPPEPVVTHEQVEKWHERLLGESEAAQAARSYLMGDRAIAETVFRAARIGLAHSPSDYRATHWIMIPVPYRHGGDPAPIVAVKGFAFNPSAEDWKRGDDGRKIPRNAGSAALYDLVPSDPFDTPVVVCEGELDALSALSNGFNAVTGTAGAGTFKPEWARYLASLAPAQEHGVVVAFDGDEKGKKGAQKAAPTLHEAGLDVRVASLPDGRDVNDVLTGGGSADLHAYLARADYCDPPQAEEDEPDVEDVGDSPDVQPLLGTEEPEPMKWRVADFVPEGFLTMLVGDGGTGKSLLSLYLSLCVCMGRPFLGMGTRKGRVLYVDHELDHNEQLRRVHRVARGMDLDAGDSALRDRFLYWRPHNPLGSEKHQEAILEAVETYDVDLVILDSLTMGAEGDVTDVADVVPIMQHIRQWPTTIAIDHVSHDTAKRSAAQARAFGSVFKRNAARSSLTLAQSDTGGYCIQQEKSNFSDGDGRLVYAVDWTEDEITFETIPDADERAAGLLSDLSSKDVTLVAVKDMWEASNQPVMPSDVVTWREEHDAKTIGEGTVRNHFTALKKRGEMSTDKHGGAIPSSAQHESPAALSDDPPF